MTGIALDMEATLDIVSALCSVKCAEHLLANALLCLIMIVS